MNPRDDEPPTLVRENSWMRRMMRGDRSRLKAIFGVGRVRDRDEDLKEMIRGLE